MKKVFEYMGWKYTYPHKTVYDSLNERHNLDGNDMVEAIQKMNEKGDWIKFYLYVENVYFKKSPFGFNTIEEAHATFFHWLFSNPDNFFKLMEEWLNEKADQL